MSEAKELTSAKIIAPASEYVRGKYASTKEGVYGYAETKYAEAATYAEGTITATKEKAAPYVAKAQEKAAPYVASGRELAAPYLAKLDSKREEIVKGKRYEAAMAKLSMAREHPAELA